MDKQQVITQARELVSEAELGSAIDLLQAFLKSELQYRPFLSRSVQIEAAYKKLRKEQASGLVSFENAQIAYNQATNQFLALLEALEKGELPVEERKAEPRWQFIFRSPKFRLALTILPILAIALTVGVLFRQGYIGDGKGREFTSEPPNSKVKTSPPEEGAKMDFSCPAFEPGAAFKVLLLPFFNPSGAAPIPVQAQLRERLEELARRYDLNLSAAILTDFPVQDYGVLNYREAGRLGRRCAARLIIWGRAEKVGAEGFIVSTRFKYLGASEGLQFTKLAWEGENELRNVRAISAIDAESELTADIEQVILFALGVAAHQEGQYAVAAEVLKQATPTDTSSALMRDMMLADAYLQMNQPEDALSYLDEVLQIHPDYWLALNNRGMLLLKNRDYYNAIEDFSKALKAKEDPNVRTARGKAFLESGHLKKAEEDLETVKKKDPANKEALNLLEKTRKSIAEQRKIITESKQKLRSNPDDPDALQRSADANLKLGNERAVRQLTAKGLKIDRSNPKFYIPRIEALLAEGKRQEALKVLQEARRNGVSAEKIFEINPALRKALFPTPRPISQN